MKKVLRLFIALIILPFADVYCQKGKKAEPAETKVKVQTVPYFPNFRNNTLPHQPKMLKILGIGNSFTDDGMQYLPDLIESAGIENVMLARIYIGGCSLERHWREYSDGDTAYTYYKSYAGKNVWEKQKRKERFIDAVTDENWDIIVIQQASSFSGKYDSYQPYLNQLIDVMVGNCSNAGVCLAWQMTWAYGSGSTHAAFPKYNKDQQFMYKAIMDATRMMAVESGIDIIIPSATAIQNLRGTSLNNPPLDLTRDGYHAGLGAGRYTLACTWFQTLIAPCFGTSVIGNSFRTTNGKVPVDNDETALLCQKAAQMACIRRWMPSEIHPSGR